MQKLFIVLLAMALLFLNRCAKENIIPVAENEHLAGRRVRYSVLVVSGSDVSKSDKTIHRATVSLVMNDSVYQQKTDSAGMVTFNNLAAGNIAVKIEKTGFTTAVYRVDLTLSGDSLDQFDTDNLRNASSIIALLPTVGSGTAIVSGKAFADLDATNDQQEFAPQGLGINFSLIIDSQSKFHSHEGSGIVLDFFYENSAFSTSVTNVAGDFSLNVPATPWGMKILINGDDFVYDKIIDAQMSRRTIYRFVPDTITVFSNRQKIKDLEFFGQ